MESLIKQKIFNINEIIRLIIDLEVKSVPDLYKLFLEGRIEEQEEKMYLIDDCVSYYYSLEKINLIIDNASFFQYIINKFNSDSELYEPSVRIIEKTYFVDSEGYFINGDKIKEKIKKRNRNDNG